MNPSGNNQAKNHTILSAQLFLVHLLPREGGGRRGTAPFRALSSVNAAMESNYQVDFALMRSIRQSCSAPLQELLRVKSSK